jgi:hypothetical protein
MIDRGYALSAIAARTGMPSIDTLCGWLSENDDFRERYDAARGHRREKFADEVVALADTVAGQSAAGMRLRLDARKWRVALMDKEAAGKNTDADAHKDEFVARLREAEARIAARASIEAVETHARAATTSAAVDGPKCVVPAPKVVVPAPKAVVPEPEATVVETKAVTPASKAVAPAPKAAAAIAARDAKDARAKDPPNDAYTWTIAFPGGGADVTASNSLAGEWWR